MNGTIGSIKGIMGKNGTIRCPHDTRRISHSMGFEWVFPLTGIILRRIVTMDCPPFQTGKQRGRMDGRSAFVQDRHRDCGDDHGHQPQDTRHHQNRRSTP